MVVNEAFDFDDIVDYENELENTVSGIHYYQDIIDEIKNTSTTNKYLSYNIGKTIEDFKKFVNEGLPTIWQNKNSIKAELDKNDKYAITLDFRFDLGKQSEMIGSQKFFDILNEIIDIEKKAYSIMGYEDYYSNNSIHGIKLKILVKIYFKPTEGSHDVSNIERNSQYYQLYDWIFNHHTYLYNVWYFECYQHKNTGYYSHIGYFSIFCNYASIKNFREWQKYLKETYREFVSRQYISEKSMNLLPMSEFNYILSSGKKYLTSLNKKSKISKKTIVNESLDFENDNDFIEGTISDHKNDYLYQNSELYKNLHTSMSYGYPKQIKVRFDWFDKEFIDPMCKDLIESYKKVRPSFFDYHFVNLKLFPEWKKKLIDFSNKNIKYLLDDLCKNIVNISNNTDDQILVSIIYDIKVDDYSDLLKVPYQLGWLYGQSYNIEYDLNEEYFNVSINGHVFPILISNKIGRESEERIEDRLGYQSWYQYIGNQIRSEFNEWTEEFIRGIKDQFVGVYHPN